MQNNDANSRLVYSTSSGAICPECAQALKSCVCRKIRQSVVPKTDGIVRCRYELAGRKGKGVTLITGLALNETGLLELAQKLKRQFGTGGSVKDQVIQLHGDFREPAAGELRKLGYGVK
jgi:translation initiation factor 1